MRSRHYGLLLSLGLTLVLPLFLIGAYLWILANDQYSSLTGFTVRQEDSGAAVDVLGGLAQFAGVSGGASDSDILYQYIRSPELVHAVDAQLDLTAYYSQNWPFDFAYAIPPDATAETLETFWQRIVRINYDRSSGLIEVRTLAFDPDFAQRLAQEVLAESQKTINALNTQAREDALRYAQADLDLALERLREARTAMTVFRSTTQIVDPEADLQGRMGVMNNLQQQLAQALVDHDLLREKTAATDPRVTEAQRRIEVIRQRIVTERESFVTAKPSDGTSGGASGEDYPKLISEYESLMLDREYAEQTYRAALAAMDLARTNAQRQSRYLATYIQPTLAESAEYPRRSVVFGMAALFLFLAWGTCALVYYSIRDRG